MGLKRGPVGLLGTAQRQRRRLHWRAAQSLIRWAAVELEAQESDLPLYQMINLDTDANYQSLKIPLPPSQQVTPFSREKSDFTRTESYVLGER